MTTATGCSSSGSSGRRTGSTRSPLRKWVAQDRRPPLISSRLAPTSRTSRILGQIPRDFPGSRVTSRPSPGRVTRASLPIAAPSTDRSIRDEPYCVEAQVAFFWRFSHFSRVEKLPLCLFARSCRAYARVSLPIGRSNIPRALS